MRLITNKKEAELNELLDRFKRFEEDGLRAVLDCTEALKEMQRHLVGVNKLLTAAIEMEARIAALEAAAKGT